MTFTLIMSVNRGDVFLLQQVFKQEQVNQWRQNLFLDYFQKLHNNASSLWQLPSVFFRFQSKHSNNTCAVKNKDNDSSVLQDIMNFTVFFHSIVLKWCLEVLIENAVSFSFTLGVSDSRPGGPPSCWWSPESGGSLLAGSFNVRLVRETCGTRPGGLEFDPCDVLLHATLRKNAKCLAQFNYAYNYRTILASKQCIQGQTKLQRLK